MKEKLFIMHCRVDLDIETYSEGSDPYQISCHRTYSLINKIRKDGIMSLRVFLRLF